MASVWVNRFLWGLAMVIVLVGLVVGVLLFRHTEQIRQETQAMAIMVQTNQQTEQQFLARLATRYPVLRKSHGQIMPQAIDITTQTIQQSGIHPKRQIMGIQTAWAQNAVYILERSQQLHEGTIPPSVWMAGLRTAAQDLMTVAGNDPLQSVLNAGPATAPKFWALDQALYAQDFAQPHWIVQIVAQPQPYPGGPPIKVYPATYQVPHAPKAVILLRVPVVLNEIGIVPEPHHSIKMRSAMQTGAIIMALTHTGTQWQWWAEQLTIHAATSTLNPH